MAASKGLQNRRLVVVTGKGGVGKSAVTAALATLSARSGKRTLVCEVNTEERIAPLLGHAPVGPEVQELEENLFAVDIRPQESMKEYVLMTVKYERVYKTVFENRLVRYFLRFIPSLQELVLLGKVLHHVREKDAKGQYRFDHVFLDAPATGHAVSFLKVPQVLIDTVPPGPLANDATWMRDLLVDPKVTAAVLVSLPEEMPVNETLELARALATEVKVRPQAVVLNQFTPARFSAAEVLALEKMPSLRARAEDHAGRQKMSTDAARTLAQLGLPLVEVPQLFLPHFDRAAVEAFLPHLLPLWRGE